MRVGRLLRTACRAALATLVLCAGLMPVAGCGVQGEVGAGLEQDVVSDMVEVPDEVLQASGGGRQTFASGAPTLLYLNFDGATITKSNQSNAVSNTSFIGGGTVPPFSGDQGARQQVITLMKQLYAKYNVQIVTTRPTSGDYDMALIGGRPADLNLSYPSGVTGVAPMDCGDKMPRDIAFVFADSIKAMFGSSPLFAQRVAETAAHEAGHTYGLPHSGVGCDLMSYSTCATLKTFLDQQMPMQSDSYGQCGLTQMNSHQLLLGTLGAAASGPAPDTSSPKVMITSPQSGAKVQAALTVKASITDDVGVTKAELLVDGNVVATRTGAPYDFAATLSVGSHTLKVVGHDATGNQGNASVGVTVEGTQPADDTTPPMVTITSPVAGATLGQQLTVTAAVTDNKGVAKVELSADGTLVKTLTAAPYTFSLTLADGSHTLLVTGHDAAGNKGSASVSVTVDSANGPQNPTNPTPLPGTFGAICTAAQDCSSGLCAQDPDVEGRYCTQPCDTGSACPGGASCFPTSSASLNVCGPPALYRNAADDGEVLLGSCSVGGADGAGGAARVGLTPALLLLLLLAHFWRRRQLRD